MTIVVHLRGGGRMVRDGVASPRINIPMFNADRLTEPLFFSETYRLLDVRDVGAGPVATYVYEEPDAIARSFVITGERRLTAWDRLRGWWRFVKFLMWVEANRRVRAMLNNLPCGHPSSSVRITGNPEPHAIECGWCADVAKAAAR